MRPQKIHRTQGWNNNSRSFSYILSMVGHAAATVCLCRCASLGTQVIFSLCRCLALTLGGRPRCYEDSCCDRCRSRWPSLVSWWPALGSTGTPPGWFWCCVGCSIGHRCRPRSTWACRPAGSCSSWTAGGWLWVTSWCGDTFSLSKREERGWCMR